MDCKRKVLNKRMGPAILIFLALLLLPFTANGESKTIKMATTTSTENSGLLNVLLPEFTKETGIEVKVFAKGTGAAIRDGMDGNVDVIFVHAKAREETFLAEGYGAYRLGVMHNDFVIIGPAGDPAKIEGMRDAAGAFRKIAAAKVRFISRGDDSGTHIKEQAVWKASGEALKTEATEIIKKGKKEALSFVYPVGLGKRYISIGQGMGKALTFAEEKQAYTLADRGTFLKYKYGRKLGLNLEILCEGDPKLFNPYGVIPVSPKKHAHVKFAWADRFARWLVSAQAQALIGQYKIAGRQAFFADAVPVAE
ncbi:MAG TPA: substrate-binding domain-containing protein [Desulfobacterales bacterium]|nr:substrate-binding domain-containing protein [Desulfobacterales bacterium]